MRFTELIRVVLARGYDCRTDLVPGNSITLERDPRHPGLCPALADAETPLTEAPRFCMEDPA